MCIRDRVGGLFLEIEGWRNGKMEWMDGWGLMVTLFNCFMVGWLGKRIKCTCLL
jgi:hypothetical protein